MNIPSPCSIDKPGENFDSHIQEVQDAQYRPNTRDLLAGLASLDKKLTEDQVDFVFSKIPLFVLADDDPGVLRAVARVVKRSRKDISELSVITCDNGGEAQEAAQAACNGGATDGVFIFDDLMGSPHGLQIYMDLADGEQQHPRIARVLFSGTLPEDIGKYVDEGVIDVAIGKPLDPNALQAAIVRAYLKAQFGPPLKNAA